MTKEEYEKIKKKIEESKTFTTDSPDTHAPFVINGQIPIEFSGMTEEGEAILLWENNEEIKSFLLFHLSVQYMGSNMGLKPAPKRGGRNGTKSK